MDALDEHRAFAQGLRELADWIEAHPEIPAPREGRVSNRGLYDRADAERVARALAPCRKDATDDLFYIVRAFGPVTYVFSFWQDQICTRRVVGFEEVPERVIPATRREIVEWECSGILSTER